MPQVAFGRRNADDIAKVVTKSRRLNGLDGNTPAPQVVLQNPKLLGAFAMVRGNEAARRQSDPQAVPNLEFGLDTTSIEQEFQQAQANAQGTSPAHRAQTGDTGPRGGHCGGRRRPGSAAGTAPHRGARRAQADCVRLLLGTGVQASLEALHDAIDSGSNDAVGAVQEAGADLYGQHGDTAGSCRDER